MVGPFMQGMLLMGVIYWYSKGMLNMINEYYRTEFQKQLQPNTADRKTALQDEIEILLTKQEKGIDAKSSSLLSGDILDGKFCPINHQPDVCFNQIEFRRFLELTLAVCFMNTNFDTLPNDAENYFKGCQDIASVPSKRSLGT